MEHKEMNGHQDARLTVLVPAYNESATVGATIQSLLVQTVRPGRIIVIDDCSTDNTSQVAAGMGATVMRPPRNSGSKAGAQNFALGSVQTEFTLAIDADTTLAPDAVQKMLAVADDPDVTAACGFVLPRYVKTLWERGRYIEYLFAFSFFKQVQDYYTKPIIASGCFSMYRTQVLKEMGGWSTRTVAEDMDLTWRLYQMGKTVRFVPDAVCYPVEPHSFAFMSKQLRRWSHGFVQNVRLHWRMLLGVPFLRSLVAVAVWDAVLASLAYLLLLPLLAVLVSPLFLLGYVIDVPAVIVPILPLAIRRGEFWKAMASLPSFLVLRAVNCVYTLEAFWSELLTDKKLMVFEKGH
jgi:biofilm PGA synthesis N-glycosyltransferase PgaC